MPTFTSTISGRTRLPGESFHGEMRDIDVKVTVDGDGGILSVTEDEGADISTHTLVQVQTPESIQEMDLDTYFELQIVQCLEDHACEVREHVRARGRERSGW